MEQLSFLGDNSSELLEGATKILYWQGWVSDGASLWPSQVEPEESWLERYAIKDWLARYESVMKVTRSLTDTANSKPLPARLLAILPCPFDEEIDEVAIVTNSIAPCRNPENFSGAATPDRIIAVFQAKYFRMLGLTGSPLEKDLRLNWSLNYFGHAPLLGIWDKPFEAILPTREHLRFAGMPIGGPRFNDGEADLCIEALDEAFGHTNW